MDYLLTYRSRFLSAPPIYPKVLAAYMGLVYLGFGLACLAITVFFDTRVEQLLSGLSGAGIAGGLYLTLKYIYWTRPDRISEYQERLASERIELNDERKVMLRDKSGRYAYLAGLLVVSLSIIVFSILGNLGIIADPRPLVVYLGAYFWFQYIIGIVIYRQLSKRY